MPKFAQKISLQLFYFIFIILVAFINWWQPVYMWLGDTPVYRFIWLGIFFILLDLFIDNIMQTIRDMRLMGEMLSLGRDIKKISGDFRVSTKLVLPNNVKADYVVVGSSGVWLIDVRGDEGKVSFNGDNIVQGDLVLGGLLTKSLEKAYSLSAFLKENLKKDFTVTPVVAFSSSKIHFESMPKNVRGVYVVSGKDTVPLVENTDVQLIDKNTIEEVHKLLGK